MTNTEKIRMNIIRYRKENDMTQEDVAKRLNMPRGTYAAYEQGYASPSIVTLSRLADIYHISIKELTEEQEGAYLL